MSNIGQPWNRLATATLVINVMIWVGVVDPSHAECVTKESHCGKDWAFCPDNPALTPIVGDGCSSIPNNCPKPAYCRPDPKTSCGEHWTEWRNLGEATNDPCPAGCVATERVGHDSRNVNAFFQMQYRERWSCGGTPLSRDRRAFK